VSYILKEIKGIVDITRNGACLIGKNFCCDGFNDKRNAGAITHFHEDHTTGLNSALSWYKKIFVSKATRDLLIASKGNFLKYKNNLVAIPYYKKYSFNDEKITLYPAIHVLGSSQILIESNKKHILYTGDIREGTNPIETDILLLQPHYGKPNHVRKHKRDDVVKNLVKQIKSELKTKSVCILACKGKLQSIMNLLYKADIDVPFLANKTVKKIAEVYTKHDQVTGNIIDLSSFEANEIITSRNPHVTFYPINTKICRRDIYVKFTVSEWNVVSQIKYKIAKNEYMISISDHADFKGLIDFVKKCKPKFVIADNIRCSGSAEKFVNYLNRYLKIKSTYLPK